MLNRQVGKSDIKASAIAMGAWAIGGGAGWSGTDDSTSIKAIHAALDAGVTWFDTAPAYAYGHSEEVVGKALAGKRDKVVLSTKCGLQWYEPVGSKHMGLIDHSLTGGKQMYRNLSPQSIRRDLENSLRRLQTDYIDIYITHWQSSDLFYIPIEETYGELLRMKQQGLIRAFGASNVCVNHLKEYTKCGGIDMIQEKFSMLDRKVEKELLPYCEENQITLQAYSPIEQGLLAGKATLDYVVPHGDAREHSFWWKPENRKVIMDMLNGWRDLTEKYNCSIGNLTIHWTMMRSEQLNVLFGARKVENVLENVYSSSFVMDKSDLQRMTRDADAAIQNCVK